MKTHEIRETEMTGQQSLELIARMIRNTQEKMEERPGSPFLIWGYATFFMAVAVWSVFRFLPSPSLHWMWLWMGIPVLGATGTFIARNRQPRYVTTFIDRVAGNIWMVVGVCCGLTGIYAGVAAEAVPVLFVEGLLLSAGAAITGLVIRLHYVTVSAFAGIALSFSIPFFNGLDQILVFALLALILFVIPGHTLNIQGLRRNASASGNQTR